MLNFSKSNEQSIASQNINGSIAVGLLYPLTLLFANHSNFLEE